MNTLLVRCSGSRDLGQGNYQLNIRYLSLERFLFIFIFKISYVCLYFSFHSETNKNPVSMYSDGNK